MCRRPAWNGALLQRRTDYFASLEEATSGFRRFVADRHSGAYGKVHYRPEEFGLDSRTEAGRFRDYIECFAIESEGSAGESGGEGRRSLVGMPVTSASGAF